MPIIESLVGTKVYGFGNLLASTAFESIASASGTGSSATITFGSIPSTYQSLQIRGIMGCSAATDLAIRFNGIETNTYYAYHSLTGDGSTITASGTTSGNNNYIIIGNVNNDTNLAVVIIDIHNYKSTTANKTVRSFSGYDANSAGVIGLRSGLFIDIGAITTLDLRASAGNPWTTKTQFALYGIKGAA